MKNSLTYTKDACEQFKITSTLSKTALALPKSALALCLIAIMLFSGQAYAQASAEEGLDKLKTNIDNSKYNIEQYKKNLRTVDENLAEIKKAQDIVQNQNKKLQDQITAHNALLKKTVAQEKELTRLVTQEKEKNAKDDLRLKEIEELIVQMKKNQEIREKNKAEYEKQLSETTEYKKQWQSHADSLKEQQLVLQKNLQDIQSQGSTWTAKKKGYDGEIKRWTSETEKQQKSYDAMRSIANEKAASPSKPKK